MGGSNSVPTTSDSTQAYVSGSGTVTKGSVITLSSGSTELCSFTVPEDYSGSSSSSGGGRPGGGSSGGGIVITCPGLASGTSYTLKNGTSSSTVTATLKGSGGGRPW